MLDSKGQEFSVFKLLISAVIAIVILTILLQIIGAIRPISVGDPQKAAETLIKQIDAANYTEIISDNVTFSTGKSLTAAGIADVSGGLTAKQICLDAGIFSSRNNGVGWEKSTDKLIYYEGSAEQRARLVGVCIPKGFDGEIVQVAPTLAADNVWSSPECISCAESEKCCYIALISPEA